MILAACLFPQRRLRAATPAAARDSRGDVLFRWNMPLKTTTSWGWICIAYRPLKRPNVCDLVPSKGEKEYKANAANSSRHLWRPSKISKCWVFPRPWSAVDLQRLGRLHMNGAALYGHINFSYKQMKRQKPFIFEFIYQTRKHTGEFFCRRSISCQ